MAIISLYARRCAFVRGHSLPAVGIIKCACLGSILYMLRMLTKKRTDLYDHLNFHI